MGLDCGCCDAADSSLCIQRDSSISPHLISPTSVSALQPRYKVLRCWVAIITHKKTNPTDVFSWKLFMFYLLQLYCLFLQPPVQPCPSSSPSLGEEEEVSMTDWSVAVYSSMKRCSSSFQLSTHYTLFTTRMLNSKSILQAGSQRVIGQHTHKVNF